MANTYTLIASTELGVPTSSVVFSGISQSYSDLVLRMSARNTSNSDLVYLTFNSDSATNYSRTRIRGTGSTSDSSSQTSQTLISLDGTINPSSYTANSYASSEIYIPSYTKSQNKPFHYFGATETNAATAYIYLQANLWRNTAAISTITLSTASGNFDVVSTFFLYGIKNT